MEDEKAVDAPVRFFAIGHSDYEGYWETFVFATSAEDALHKYQRWLSHGSARINPRVEKVDVLEAEINDFGVMESTDPVIQNAEVQC